MTETSIIKTMIFIYIERVNHILGYMKKTFTSQLHYLEKTRSLCYGVFCKQVSSHMQDLFTFPILFQNGHQKVDVFFHQRANSTTSSDLDILSLYVYNDGFK